MQFAAAVLRIHKRPCATPGENGELDMPFVKNEWKMCRRPGDAVEGRDCHKYVLYANAEAVDSSR